MNTDNSAPYEKGLALLKHPVLPLVRMVKMLFLFTPFDTIDPLLDELVEPIETEGVSYENPGRLLHTYLPQLKHFEAIKKSPPETRIILNEQLEPLALFEALELRVSQEILTRELEEINSLLCGPCGCTLCCVGPDSAMGQDFFEIPLSENEVTTFSVPKRDTDDTRKHTSASEPPLREDGLLFYERKEPALYHWQTGWSMILPKHSTCPNLVADTGACRIYADRPEVCRRPQIFAYVLEREQERDKEVDGKMLPAYVARKKVLAIWDCPYVQRFKEEIATYILKSGMEPVFKENKS